MGHLFVSRKDARERKGAKWFICFILPNRCVVAHPLRRRVKPGALASLRETFNGRAEAIPAVDQTPVT